jgi:CheY-like chemotaxis protein
MILKAGMTILIVDDNRSMRRILARAVEKSAARIWECVDGADALAAYIDHSPDLVLMDVQMPGLDGLEATRQIVGFDATARVVIVTDFDDDELRAAAREAGASGYVLKQDLTALDALLA